MNDEKHQKHLVIKYALIGRTPTAHDRQPGSHRDHCGSATEIARQLLACAESTAKIARGRENHSRAGDVS